jgi:hypothetical protein
MAMLFDTLEASRQLQEAGFPEPQAHAIVTAFTSGILGDVATRDDLALLKDDLAALEERLEQRLTIRFGAMVAGATALILAAMAIATAILLAAG